MLKGNLSTRPFYNQRLAAAAVGFVALVVVLLTAYNATRLIALSAERRELKARIDRDRGEAAAIRGDAQARQRTVDRAVLARLATSAVEANDLIDQRTFSWTAFFGLIEETLPLDVRLVVVSPRAERGVFKVSMTVVAKDIVDISNFADALAGTGRFYDVVPTQQQRRDDGAYDAVIEGAYLTPSGQVNVQQTPAAATPAPSVARPAR
jgi:hypothetical protein